MTLPAQGLAENIKLYIGKNGDRHELPKAIANQEMQVSLERTISAASTLELIERDPERILATAGYFTKNNRADIEFDKLWFRCCRFAKVADEYTLTAEDRDIAVARQYKGKHHKNGEVGLKMAAANQGNPRARFIRMMLKDAVPWAPFWCPELNVRPVILPAKETEAEKKANHAKGAASGELRIGGEVADPDQQKNATIVAEVCDALKVPEGARIAIFCAALGESKFRTHNPNPETDADGVFQLLPSTAQNLGLSPYNTKATAEHWLKEGYYHFGGGIAQAREGTAPGQIAENVEGSGAGASYYENFRGNAIELIAALGGGATASSGTSEEVYTPQRYFTLPINEAAEGEEREGAWECGSAYAEEVDWRLFGMAGRFNFVSDAYLEKSKPLMRIDEGSPGIVDIKWEIDARQEKDPPTLEVEARAPLWYAPPGSVVVIGEKDGEEAHEGVWLVGTIKRPDITDNAVTITCERPRKPLAEYELPTATRPRGPGKATRDGGWDAGISEHEGELVATVYNTCIKITNEKLPYVYGGGHGTNFQPTDGEFAYLSGPVADPVGYDCSGAVSAALGEYAKLLKTPENTTLLEKWGEPGPGKHMTLWVRSEPDGHCFLEFTNLQGNHKAREVFVAHYSGGPLVGFGEETTAEGNWQPRHWPRT